jgi:hypothetical protein
MNTTWPLILTLAALGLGLSCAAETAKDPHAGAKKLIAESKCETCHAKKVGGDGTGMYTREGRIVKTKTRVAAQVSLCNSELNLGLFPEDETAIAAYLNEVYYKFK